MDAISTPIFYFVIHFYSPQKNFEKENEDLCNSAVEFRDVSSLI